MSRIVLGIDPGVAATGFGAVAESNGHLELVEYGCLTTGRDHSRAWRLHLLHEAFRALLERVCPHEVAVEQLFFSRNVQTAMAVGEARGVALLAAAARGLPVSEYTPTQVKQALTGSGRADKREVRAMVVMQLGLPQPPRPDDASDALAVALTHCFYRRLEPS